MTNIFFFLERAFRLIMNEKQKKNRKNKFTYKLAKRLEKLIFQKRAGSFS